MVKNDATLVSKNVAKRRLKKRVEQVRLSVTLSAAQRKMLQAIADRNHTSIAYVIRYALDQFIADNRDRQLRLSFPDAAPAEE